MQWFKFYGQDFLTDPKMRVLTLEQKMCWVVLMCLANAEDKDGSISFIKESEVMQQAGIEIDSPMWHKTAGFIKLFQELGMITISNETVTNSNVVPRYNIKLNNFNARQTKSLSNAERQKKFRESQKIKAKKKTKTITKSNEEPRYDNNARIEENRTEKNNKKENIKEKYANAFKEFCELIDYWNSLYKKKYKPIEETFRNFLYWRKQYSIEEMKGAVKNIPYDEYWHDKIDPTIFFRRSGKNHQAVDYIGRLLNVSHEEETPVVDPAPPSHIRDREIYFAAKREQLERAKVKEVHASP